MAMFQDARVQQIQANWLGKVKQVFAISRERFEEYKISWRFSSNSLLEYCM